jgi:hypothetical protein
MKDTFDLITLFGKTYSVAEIIKEKDEFVRMEAINYDFALTELAHDTSSLVRTAAAKKAAGHEHLCTDLNWRVRATVAQHCTDTQVILILAKDENDFVRFIIAKRGFAAHLLLNDSDPEIVSLARENLQHAQAA